MCQLTKNGQQRIFVDNKLLKDLFATAGTAGYFLAERPFDSWLSILYISFFHVCIVDLVTLEKLFPGHSTKTTELLFPCGKKYLISAHNTRSVITTM